MVFDFESHKKALDNYLEKIEFLYSGDIISSVEKEFVIERSNSSFSSLFIKDILVELYNFSFENMVENSTELVFTKGTDLVEVFEKVNDNIRMAFYSESSKHNLLKTHIPFYPNSGSHWLPSYFHTALYYNGQPFYFSPKIEDDKDDSVIYLVDGAIQSMVWSLQNMEYIIEDNKHIVRLPFYYCKYKSYKVRIVDIEKLRDDKINLVLDGDN